MAFIGFLGYFQFEKLSSTIFSFFYGILGKYSIVLPIICVIFSVICWRIKISDSATGEDFENENLDNEEIYGETKVKSKNQKSGFLKEQFFLTNNKKIITKENGFDSYFSNNLPIKEEVSVGQKDLSYLGTDFASYFGQGEKNIYLPPKIINLHGFEEYFSKGENFVITKKRAANDIDIRTKSTKILPETRKIQINNNSLKDRFSTEYNQGAFVNNLSINLNNSSSNPSCQKTYILNEKMIDNRENLNYINSSYAKKVVDYENLKKPEDENEDNNIELNELFQQAAELVILHNFVSPSFLQRRLRVGYSKVIQLIKMLEDEGVISKYEDDNSRAILMNMETFDLKYKK